jgi:Uma2 family endonuclease
MTAARKLVPVDDDDQDHIVHLHGVSWADYLRVLRMRGDHSAPRITYLEGELEIMSPSRSHEFIKSHIGRLVEVYCLEHDIDFEPYGSWTIKKKPARRGAEPDECYVFGDVRDPKRPDLAIEVVWTSGRIDKLEVYRKLGVREVWYWRDGELRPYQLWGERYRPIARSKVLAGIDLAELTRFVERSPVSRAIREYRAALVRRRRRAAR